MDRSCILGKSTAISRLQVAMIAPGGLAKAITICTSLVQPQPVPGAAIDRKSAI
jgi:hypothetical protein